MKKTVQPEDWISMAAAARIRGVSRAAIADLVRRQRLGSCQIGGRTLVIKREVEQFEPRPLGRPAKKATGGRPRKPQKPAR